MTNHRRHSLLYMLHLRSPLWRLRRRLWILGARGRCERCGSRRRPTIHHRSYRRLGHERRSDVEVLCWPCHRAEHGGGPTSLTSWRRWFMRAALLALAVLLAVQLLWAVAHGVPHR
jgi:5-methylcytosine-specific restriction endonuclease McrA